MGPEPLAGQVMELDDVLNLIEDMAFHQRLVLPLVLDPAVPTVPM